MKQTILSALALVLLSACLGGGGSSSGSGDGGTTGGGGTGGGGTGGGGTGGGGSGGGGGSPPLVGPIDDIFATAGSTQNFSIDQALRGNPDFVASSAHGATGIVALSLGPDATPEFRDMRVRLSENGETLTVEIEGLLAYQLLRDSNRGAIGGQWGFGLGPLATLTNFNNTGDIDFSIVRAAFNLDQAVGVYGHVTPENMLPNGGVDYNGNWSVDHPSSSDTMARNSAGGRFDMRVDFGTGLINGTTSDGRNSFFQTVEYGGTGVITGSVTGMA